MKIKDVFIIIAFFAFMFLLQSFSENISYFNSLVISLLITTQFIVYGVQVYKMKGIYKLIFSLPINLAIMVVIFLYEYNYMNNASVSDVIVMECIVFTNIFFGEKIYKWRRRKKDKS